MAEGRPRSRRQRGEAPAPPGPEAALEIALRFLGSRPRTRWELERRLRRAGAADSVVTSTLERLESIGYADDAAFVLWWAEQRDRHAPRGRRMLEAELRGHGVSRDVIEAFYAEPVTSGCAPEDAELPATEHDRARAALDRHLRGRPVPADPRALQRVGMFLMRRGFDPETVRSVLRAAGSADDAEE